MDEPPPRLLFTVCDCLDVAGQTARDDLGFTWRTATLSKHHALWRHRPHEVVECRADAAALLGKLPAYFLEFVSANVLPAYESHIEAGFRVTRTAVWPIPTTA